MAKKKTNATRAPAPVTEAAARASAELTELGARFALVGGLALRVRSCSRRSREQPQEHRRRNPARRARGVHRRLPLGYDVDVPWRELPKKDRDFILFTDEQPNVPA